MFRSMFCAGVVALALASAAVADGGGPAPGVSQGSDGIAAPGRGVRYVTLPAGAWTNLEALRTRDARVLRFSTLAGSWGIPLVTSSGATGGLTVDGNTLVLADASPQQAQLRKESTFLFIDTKTMQARTFVRLRGDFAFDALSPSGQRLYLIQHMTAADLSRYVVRAYDLEHARLLPQAIADRTQRGWVMQGYAVARVTSAGGRWVYTLYRHDGGFPFIHALDAVRGTAHCIGVPWHGSQDGLWNLQLSLRDGGQRLALNWKSGTSFASVDTQTFRISRSTGGGSSSFPWWAVGAGSVALAGLLAGGILGRGALLRAARRVKNHGLAPRTGAESA